MTSELFRTRPWTVGDKAAQSQELAAKLLKWACRDSAVATNDSRYRNVLEGRVYKPPSSSCGDLAHWLFYRLGVRLPWVNRKENGGWRPGLNVSLLCWPPHAPARAAKPEDVYLPGDMLVIYSRKDGTDAHVICVLNHDAEARILRTAEYGQPGGALRVRGIRPGHLIGARKIQRVLRLADVLEAAEEMGKLVDAEEPIE